MTHAPSSGPDALQHIEEDGDMTMNDLSDARAKIDFAKLTT